MKLILQCFELAFFPPLMANRQQLLECAKKSLIDLANLQFLPILTPQVKNVFSFQKGDQSGREL